MDDLVKRLRACANGIGSFKSNKGDFGLCDDAADRIEALEAALRRIREWSYAYPLEVFPEPDFAAAAKVLKDAGLSLDSISASNMRHVASGVRDIADKALTAPLHPTPSPDPQSDAETAPR